MFKVDVKISLFEFSNAISIWQRSFKNSLRPCSDVSKMCLNVAMGKMCLDMAMDIADQKY